MEPEQALEICKTDPKIISGEKEFSITFTKEDDRALISSSIASQVKRAIQHTDIIVDDIRVYNEDTDTYRSSTVEDLDAEDGDRIVAFNGTVPIESLKINASPRSARSYADIFSTQNDVSIESGDNE